LPGLGGNSRPGSPSNKQKETKKSITMTQKRAPNPPISDRWSYLWLVMATVLLVFTYGMYRNPLAALLALHFV
jgi:hypothetical protein